MLAVADGLCEWRVSRKIFLLIARLLRHNSDVDREDAPARQDSRATGKLM